MCDTNLKLSVCLLFHGLLKYILNSKVGMGIDYQLDDKSNQQKIILWSEKKCGKEEIKGVY